MDLRNYYQKVKDIGSKIPDTFTVVVSLETGDGGKAGRQTEVSRALAAKMIVDGTARLATPDEKQAFHTHRTPMPPATK
jgi:hypothetical protein